MTRDELLKTINEEVTKVLPDGDADLDGDDFDSVETVVEKVCADAVDAIDEDKDEEEQEEPEGGNNKAS